MLLDKRHAPSRKITKWTSPLLKLCAQGQSWITQCYVTAMRSITRAQARELKKIQRNLRRKKGLVFKTEASCCRWSHFPVFRAKAQRMRRYYSALSRSSSIWSSIVLSTLKNNAPLASVLCVFCYRWWYTLPEYFRVLVFQLSCVLGSDRQLSLYPVLFGRACYTGGKNSIINQVKIICAIVCSVLLEKKNQSG